MVYLLLLSSALSLTSVLGPNAFEVVDDPASVVNARRTDLTMQAEVFPTTVPTFNAVVIEWLHLEDTDEIGRLWTSEAYYNCYGFGDAAVCMRSVISTSLFILPYFIMIKHSFCYYFYSLLSIGVCVRRRC